MKPEDKVILPDGRKGWIRHILNEWAFCRIEGTPRLVIVRVLVSQLRKLQGKRTVGNTGVHGLDHQKYAWFAQPHYDPASDEVCIMRKAFHHDYEHVLYNAATLVWIGYARPKANLTVSRAYAKKQGTELLVLKLPVPALEGGFEDTPKEEPPGNWNPAWGEDPREE